MADTASPQMPPQNSAGGDPQASSQTPEPTVNKTDASSTPSTPPSPEPPPPPEQSPQPPTNPEPPAPPAPDQPPITEEPPKPPAPPEKQPPLAEDLIPPLPEDKTTPPEPPVTPEVPAAPVPQQPSPPEQPTPPQPEQPVPPLPPTPEVPPTPETPPPAPEVPATPTPPPVNQPQQQQAASGQAPLPEFMKQAPHQPTVNAEEKLWAFISYIPLLGLIAMIMKPRSEFVKLHGKQGAVITLIFFLNIFFYLIPFIEYFAALIHLTALILIGFSMYQALIGNWWKTPVIGDIADILPIDALVKVSREAMMGEKAQEENDQNQQPPPSNNQPTQ